MVPLSSLTRTIFLGLILVMPAGCANFGWRTQPAPAKPTLDEPPGPPPNYTPALRIGGPAGGMPTSAAPQNPTGSWTTRPQDTPTQPTPPNTGTSPQSAAPGEAGTVVRAVSMENPRPAAAELSLREIERLAGQRLAEMDSYQMRLRRREVVSGQQRPEEIVLCKIRKEPFSVYLKWVGPAGNKREAVYVQGQFDNAIHTLTAAGDIPFTLGGQHIKISPDSILVKNKSRYPITEAGIGPLVSRFDKLVAAAEKGDSREGVAQVVGRVKRPEFDDDLLEVRQSLPPGADPNLPHGGQRRWFFSTVETAGIPAHLPVLLIANDETGKEVEYYCHDRFVLQLRLDDRDFNPDVLWAQGKGR